MIMIWQGSHLALKPMQIICRYSLQLKFENNILKEDAATYKRKILTLELANKLSTRNAKKLKSQVSSLSYSLKIEKNKSRVAIQCLLTVTTMQHNEMIAKFQAKIGNIQTEHIALSTSFNVAEVTRYSTIRNQLCAY